MIVSVRTLPADHVFDVCIAGSGPAGMTLGLALADRGKSVLVLEGGDAEFSDAWQALSVGETVGDPYRDLDIGRLRQLGGSSNHWGGWCRPLDPVDFAYKAYSPEAHWPFDRSELDPYLEPALAILDAPGGFSDRQLDENIKQINFTGSDPIVSFATKYISNIANQENLVVSLNSAVVDIEIQRSRIASFRVRDLQGENRAVRAENFVLACGGIENSRLLLHFAARSEGRLAANPDALGRYWMEHPHYTIGEVVMTDPDETGREVFSPMPERMLRSGVLNCGLRLEWTRDRKGLRRAAHDLGCAAPTLGRWIYRQMDKRLICIGTLRAAWEQEPNPDSRVRLSAGRRDAFGMPLAVLEWRKTARDVATARNAAIDLGAFLARTGRARVRLHDWVTQDGPWPANDEHGGFHHMGGTRMSDVPARGVVDRDLRLWSSDNLFVAGSSVFPAAGHANPTLTIVQLSLRLADRLG